MRHAVTPLLDAAAIDAFADTSRCSSAAAFDYHASIAAISIMLPCQNMLICRHCLRHAAYYAFSR